MVVLSTGSSTALEGEDELKPMRRATLRSIIILTSRFGRRVSNLSISILVQPVILILHLIGDDCKYSGPPTTDRIQLALISGNAESISLEIRPVKTIPNAPRIVSRAVISLDSL